MNDLDMTLIDMKSQCPIPNQMRIFEVEIFFLDAPIDTIEMFRDCTPDIEEQIKEELSEEIWEYIQEELSFNTPVDKSNTNNIDNVIYE